MTDCVGWWRWLRTRKFAGRKGDDGHMQRSLKNALSSNYCQKPLRRRTTRGHSRRRKRHHQGPRPSQPVGTDVRDLSLSSTNPPQSRARHSYSSSKLRRQEIIASITTNRASSHQRRRRPLDSKYRGTSKLPRHDHDSYIKLRTHASVAKWQYRPAICG